MSKPQPQVASTVFDRILEEELSDENADISNDLENLSAEELSDDSSSSSELSDPLEAFGLNDSGRRSNDSADRKPKNLKVHDEIPPRNVKKAKPINIQSEIAKFLKKTKERISKGLKFIDYGPPYTKTFYGGHLGNECAEEFPSLFRIHTLLNNRANPNVPDPTELYFTPMHWCGRFCHFTIMRMLRRAGAGVNPVNEFGQSPLTLVCMWKQPPNRAEKQKKCAKWLIEQGANVNHIDKGGYTPIDFCAMNQNYELVALLLEKNAKVSRKNKMFVVQRRNILEYITDTKSRLLIKTKLEIWEKEMREKEEEEYEKKRHKEMITRLRENHKIAKEFRFQRIENKKLEKIQQQMIITKHLHESTVNDETSKLLHQQPNFDLYKYGLWRKDEEFNAWNFQKESSLKERTDAIIPASRKLMKKLDDRNDFDKFNSRWSSITGNPLEVNWEKKNVFRLPEIHNPKKLNKNASFLVEEKQEIGDDTVDQRDENDEELIDENIDDLMEVL